MAIKSSPCPVFLLLGNGGSILALLVLPRWTGVIPHLLLHLHILLEDLVGSCIARALKGGVGFQVLS